MQATSSNDPFYNRNYGFHPDDNTDHSSNEKRVIFADKEYTPLPEQKKLIDRNILDDKRSSANMLNEITKTEEEFWDSPFEEILRGEFSEFDKWKKTRNRGQAFVMRTYYTRLILHNWFYIGLVVLFLIISLFLTNIRLACCNNSGDIGVDIVILVTIIFFLFDFICNVLGSVDYIISFDFWSDFASIGVMIFDLSWVRNDIFLIGFTTLKVGAIAFYYIVDIVRLVRITKFIKLFFLQKYTRHFQYFMKFYEIDEEAARGLAGDLIKEQADLYDEDPGRVSRTRPISEFKARSASVASRKKKSNEAEGQGEIVGGFSAKAKLKNLNKRKRKYKTSRISHRILYLATKRIMVTIILLFIIIPLMSFKFYFPTVFSIENDLLLLQANNQQIAVSYINNNMGQFYSDNKIPLINITWNGLVNIANSDSSYLRPAEIMTVSSDSTNRYVISVSTRYYARLQAILNILRVIFILIFYFHRLYSFEKHANEQIMTPIDRLLDRVRLMAKNPSQALLLTGEYREMKNSDLIIIEDVIQKIAYLLVLGFGEAGNSILSKVLTISKDLSVDYLGKPNTVFAIFGFCDIRNFTDVTEILVDDVLNFVNAIAKIVHTEVSENQGGANKNIGDAFLVVWRLKGKDKSDVDKFTRASQSFDQAEKIRRTYLMFERNGTFDQNVQDNDLSGFGDFDPETLQQKHFNNLNNSSIAELSLISFLRIMAQLVINPVIRKYNANKRLNKGLPGYKVNLGFGLHAGSAIEGAIGSTLKIDMSYLSANVNMAPRLEGLTKVYKVPLLFTSSLYNMFTTESLRHICRRVDKVYLTGTSDFYELYTVDVFVPDLELALKEGLVKDFDKYDIVISGQEDMELEDFSNYEQQNGNNLKSDKDIRLENITDSYLSNEKKLEYSLIQSVIKKQNEEEDYIDYKDIQRMWEFLISDKPTSILVGENARESVKTTRNEMTKMYANALDLYIEQNWDSARVVFEKLMEVSGKDVKFSGVYDYMKGCDFQVPEDFNQARQTD